MTRIKMRAAHAFLLAACAALMAFAVAGAAGLTGCSAQATQQVVICDGNVETRVDVPAGATVGRALELAEIAVGEKDGVEPGQDQVLSDGQTVTITRFAAVSVTCDGKAQELELYGATVSKALKKCGIKLGKYDTCSQELGAWLSDGMAIEVVRRAKVTLTVDGESSSCVTAAKTVGALLKERGINLGKKDLVEPAADQRLVTGMEITVSRVSTKKVTVTEEIPYDTQTKEDSSMDEGTTRTEQEGVAGKKRVTYEVTYVDGKEESRKAIKEKVLKEPKSAIVVQGTKPTAPTVVKREKGSGCLDDGYWIITYSDGTTSREKI